MEHLQKIRDREQKSTGELWIAQLNPANLKFTIDNLSMSDAIFILTSRPDMSALLDIVEYVRKLETYGPDPEASEEDAAYDKGRSDVLNDIRQMIDGRLKDIP